MANVVYGPSQSTFTRTVRLALEEKGVPYTLEPVELKSAANLAVQPYGKVPALRHDDLVLHETAAIARYVDATFNGPALQPADPVSQARCDQLASIASDYFYASTIRNVVLQHVFPSGPDGSKNTDAIDQGMAETKRYLANTDALLGQTAGKYMVGDSYTLADMFHAPILFWLDQMPGGSDLIDGAPRVRACYDAAAARPSFAATMPEMPGG